MITAKNQTHKDEILAMTGIRALAAVWVVGFHFYVTLSMLFPDVGGWISLLFRPGRLGVDLFFILSGFIIAYNYEEQLHPLRLGKYKAFLWARLARLYPVHLATLFACLGLYGVARLTNAQLNTGASNWGALDFARNVFLIHAWTSDSHPSWNFPSWSISCEWLAYLCYPALAAFGAYTTVRWSRVALWMFVGLLFATQLYLRLSEWGGFRWVFMNIAFEFPAGVCLYLLYTRAKAVGKSLGFPLQTAVILTLGMSMAACARLNLNDAWLIPLLGLTLYTVAIEPQGIVSRMLACRPVCYWGRVSYSLYMTHAVTSMVMVRLLPLNTFYGRPFWLRLGACVIYFGTMAAAAAIMYHMIEEPARRRMRRLLPAKES